ncbi:prostaglandin F synthase 2 isoform X2 [Tetranychus urticae]|uniref:NADP-dependent oxidoreductase domain-containing protein n=1 Tax=Tetranychus urticae TaxID=32264 RepID=T1JUV7_TETUR|nr:prostaglandin F synthase 2 isoform X2 [Tetranychus urticae]
MSPVDRNGVKIGFGCFGIPEESVYHLIREAINVGYRHFDCAALYLNEDLIGKALGKCIDEGLVSRDDLFITSKLPMNGMSPKWVKYFLEKSIKNLDCGYLDLYLIHAPFAVKYIADDQFYPVNPETGKLDADLNTDYKITWKILEQACDEGLTRTIGVSNFNENQLIDLLSSCRIKPSVLQNETHCYLQQKALRLFCHQNEISYQSFAPLGSPKTAQESGHNVLLSDPIVYQLAEKYRVTCSQILIRWQQQMNMTPIVGSDNVKQVRENIMFADLTLSPEDLSTIDGLNRDERIFYFDHIPGTRSHPHYPF